jgi:hypothetical protein
MLNMDFEQTAKMIQNLRTDGITLTDITEELDYRDRANGNRWDDNLFEYSDEELADIEQTWCEV